METGDVFKPYTDADFLAARNFRYPTEQLRTSINAGSPFGQDAGGNDFASQAAYDAAFNTAKSQGVLNRQSQRTLTKKMAPMWGANEQYAIPAGYNLQQLHQRLGVNP